MEWSVSDKNTSTRIVESGDLLALKKWMLDTGCKCQVEVYHCDPMFFIPRDERQFLMGPVGSAGCAGPRSSEEVQTWAASRPIASDDRINVKTTFIMSKEKAKLIKTHKLSVTPNSDGETVQTWVVTDIKKPISYCCGVYKRAGFDNAYNAINQLKPDLIEVQFAQVRNSDDDFEWDTDLVMMENETVYTNLCRRK